MTAVLIALLKRTGKPLALIMLVALLLWGFGHWRYTAGQTAEKLVWSDKWSKRDKADAEAKAAREASEREEEQRRQLENNRIREDGEKQIAQVSAAAADAESVNKQLQLAIERTMQQLARSETGRLSAIASERQARADTAVLLAELYRKSDERAGQLAQYADRARIRGLTCEKAYDSIAAGRK
ncbi:DUF2514 family protein [Enterobacter roggenkampii]|uniref:DUF2514 family protein n=1 Tax=Enterobacter roggenkampii TaxID=1812935 RepID=UPI00388D970F